MGAVCLVMMPVVNALFTFACVMLDIRDELANQVQLLHSNLGDVSPQSESSVGITSVENWIVMNQQLEETLLCARDIHTLISILLSATAFPT